MARIERFEDIQAWARARELTRIIYSLTETQGLARDFGLKEQMRRSAVSIMSNIAEGYERGGDREFQHFLAIAKGSAGELRSQLYVALDAGHLLQEQFDDLSRRIKEVSSLLSGFARYLKESPLRGSKYRPPQQIPETP